MDSSRQMVLFTVGAGTIALVIGALLAFAVGRRPGRSIFAPWPLAWSALAAAMAMVFAANALGTGRFAYECIVLVCYAAFSYWFLKGLGGALRLPPHRGWFVVPAAGWIGAFGALFALTGSGFLYFPQSLIVTSMALTGLLMFGRARSKLSDAGDLAVSGALCMLALSGLRYILVMGVLAISGKEPSVDFWVYNSVLDLILLVTLAVGTMLMVTDQMRAKLQERNRELAAAKETLEVVAKVDPLTGVLNRYAFYLSLQELGNLEDYDGCLLMIDINNLKVINDTMGHVAGDRAICAVADRLRQLIRTDDRIFRWGGDEFVVLLFNASPESAVDRISRFGKVTVAANGNDAAQFEVSISWGVAPFGAGKSIEDVLKSADVHLYSSRRSLE